MQQSFSILCINCQDASTECIPSLHTKLSCSWCLTNNLKCVFPPYVRHLAQDKEDIQFCCNCASCTQSHHQCRFAGSHLSKYSRCIEYCLPRFLHCWVSSIRFIIIIAPLRYLTHLLKSVPFYSHYQMMRAVMVVFNKLLSKELLPIQDLGCMYLESRSSPPPFGLNVHQLHTQSNPIIKHCVIVITIVPGRNLSNSVLFWLRLPFPNLSWPISYPHMKSTRKL
jgi:hypothetical protein